MNPFRPHQGPNFRIRLNFDRMPGQIERIIQRSINRSADRRRITQMPAIRLRIDHHRDVDRFLLNLRILLQRRRTDFNLGAGDSIDVWNWREPSLPTGLMGDGDGDGYGDDVGANDPPQRALPPNA
ncbi:uncharacterized protein LOC6551159 [Drosophila erecta]|uniref:Uncharacterized protein n=1 Tax=Drosophila erecta TaxID=7220 RepID=B3NU11_DROER|nr:uncharacterized protein LOC6551159 [Drosophila erecta]EDV45787.1 uncharacterized protein Dere_GG18552 [Drosophila erecta]